MTGSDVDSMPLALPARGAVPITAQLTIPASLKTKGQELTRHGPCDVQELVHRVGLFQFDFLGDGIKRNHQVRPGPLRFQPECLDEEAGYTQHLQSVILDADL